MIRSCEIEPSKVQTSLKIRATTNSRSFHLREAPRTRDKSAVGSSRSRDIETEVVRRSEGSVLSLVSSLLSASSSERFKGRVLFNDRINSHFLPFTRVLIPNSVAYVRCVSAVLRGLLCLSPYLRKGINRALPVVSLRARPVATARKRPRATVRTIYVNATCAYVTSRVSSLFPVLFKRGGFIWGKKKI